MFWTSPPRRLIISLSSVVEMHVAIPIGPCCHCQCVFTSNVVESSCYGRSQTRGLPALQALAVPRASPPAAPNLSLIQSYHQTSTIANPHSSEEAEPPNAEPATPTPPFVPQAVQTSIEYLLLTGLSPKW